MRLLRLVTTAWAALTGAACVLYVHDRMTTPSFWGPGDPLAHDLGFHVLASLLLVALPSTFVLFPLLFFIALWRRRRARRPTNRTGLRLEHS